MKKKKKRKKDLIIILNADEGEQIHGNVLDASAVN